MSIERKVEDKCTRKIQKNGNYCIYQIACCSYQGVRTLFLEKKGLKGYYQCNKK